MPASTEWSNSGSSAVTRVTSAPRAWKARDEKSDGPPGVHPPSGVRSSVTLPATRTCVARLLLLQADDDLAVLAFADAIRLEFGIFGKGDVDEPPFGS